MTRVLYALLLGRVRRNNIGKLLTQTTTATRTIQSAKMLLVFGCSIVPPTGALLAGALTGIVRTVDRSTRP